MFRPRPADIEDRAVPATMRLALQSTCLRVRNYLDRRMPVAVATILVMLLLAPCRNTMCLLGNSMRTKVNETRRYAAPNEFWRVRTALLLALNITLPTYPPRRLASPLHFSPMVTLVG